MVVVMAMLHALIAASPGELVVTFPPGQEERFTVAIGDDTWFANEPVWFQADGVVYSSEPTAGTAEKTLVKDGTPFHLSGSDVWGEYETLSLSWKAGDTPVITEVKVYTAARIVAFTQSFPQGLAVNGTLDNKNGVASGFPSFRPANLTQPSGGGQRLWMAYNGWDCTSEYGCVSSQSSRVSLGSWADDTDVLPQGLEGSGPIAVMARDGSQTAVLSASASFMAQGQQHILSPAPPPPPGKKPTLIATPGHYWETNHKWAGTADNITFDECVALCNKVGCTFFDYAPGWPRSTTCAERGRDSGADSGVADTRVGMTCDNCRIVPPSMFNPQPRTTDQNYTAYCIASEGGSSCRGTPTRGPGTLAYGLTGSLTSVDPGFSIEVMMAFDAGGPNAAVRHWGSLLTTRYNKTNPEDKDFTTTHLGYDTDNGAYYYYKPEKGKTYADTLYDVHAYAMEVGIPYRHVQLDSWWYIKGAGEGTHSWTPAPNTFPDGLAVFHDETGWNITAHNRMWAADNVYATQNGGSYEWYVEGTEGVPLSQGFWNDLIANATAWGMYVYEQDWLFTEFVGTSRTLQSATLAREWLMQMGAGAQRSNRVIQYCMLWPRFALQSLEIPSVTTARASTDYAPGRNDQWIMGMSSLFLDSLALRPTKDNFFSTDRQGDGSKGVEKFNRLQAVVSTLSTGPVFPSDAIGDSDVALIMRSCMSDGLVLKPDRAATNIDSNILAKATARATGSPEPGEVQSTIATIGNFTYAYVLAADTNTITVSVDEIFNVGVMPPSSGFVAFESNTSSTLAVVDAAHPLVLPATDRWSFQLVTVAPVLEGGWVFLGEARTKWVAVSRQRFASIKPEGSAGFSVDFVGAVGEKITLGYAKATTATEIGTGRGGLSIGEAVFFDCVVPSSGKATAMIPAGKCV